MKNEPFQNLDVLGLIRTNYNMLSKSQQAVGDYIINHAEQVVTLSLVDLAESCSVSEPTIFRFLRKLGYDSYQVFRVELAQSLVAGKNENFYSEIEETDTPSIVRDKVLDFTIRCFTDSKQIIDPDKLNTLAMRLDSSPQIIVSGVGSSYCQAYDLYHKLMRLGITSQVTHDSHMLSILCSRLTPKDTFVCFTHSGESHEILSAMQIARENGAYVACITSYKNSSAAKISDCLILSSSYETNYRSDSLTSRILQMSIIDMLYILLVLHDKDKRQVEINRSRLAVAANKT